MFGTYWLIAVPADKGKQETYNRIQAKLTDSAKTFTFAVPEQLKVGTLDSLMQLSDDMVKVDQLGETVVTKLAQSLNNLVDKGSDRVETLLLANAQDLNRYIETFQWNEAKYPIRNAIRDTVDQIQKQLSVLDTELKTKMTAYNNARTALANLDRKQVGNLLVRSLAEIVKPEHFVRESEYLQTVMVVVPKSNQKDFLAAYESLSQYVVPRSAELITDDAEYVLYGVTLFKRVIGDFKTAAREIKCIVREFEYNAADIEKDRVERENLGADVKKQSSGLVRWLKTNFSEAVIAWVHLKAVRTFVESVLRYGLPVNFVAMLILPNKKNEKRARDALAAQFGHLAGRGAGDVVDDVAIVGPGNHEFFPYVSFGISFDLIK